jgi:nickel-dependent lactate racemase
MPERNEMQNTDGLMIKYDDTIITLRIPARNTGSVIGGAGEEGMYTGDPVMAAMDHKKRAELHDLVNGRTAALVVADATREVPLEPLLSAVMPVLRSACEVHLFIATGTHAPDMPGNEEIAALVQDQAKANGFEIRQVVYHDCQSGPWTLAGKTATHKNDIFVNAATDVCEVFVTFSEMKNHYFAGYSNPLKNFMPGLARQDCIMHNHSLTMDKASTFGEHPLHPDHHRRGNPLAHDIWEAFRLIVKNRPVFAVTTISKGSKPVWSAAGLVESVIPDTILEVDRRMSVMIDPADYLIVSCGGYPNDESLYIAQRALELTTAAVRDRGEILFLAGCRNGIGSGKSEENFYMPLTEEIGRIINTPVEPYRLYAHKPVKFARLLNRVNRIHFYTRLPAEKVSRIHMHPVDDPQKIIDQWLRERPDAKIHVFPDGNKYAVYRSGANS